MSGFATIGGEFCERVRLFLPQHGVWYADVSMLGDPELSGRVMLNLGSLQLSGTVQRPGTRGEQSFLRIVGGAGAWGTTLAAKSYHNDAGVKRKLVAEDAAREAGLGLERPPALKRRADGFVPGLGAAGEILTASFALPPGQSKPLEGGAAGDALLAADQPAHLRRDPHLLAAERRRGRQRREQHELALVAVVHERPGRYAVRHRELQRPGGDAVGQAEGRGRRLARVAGVLPVQVPARLQREAQAGVERLAGRDRRGGGQELDLEVRRRRRRCWRGRRVARGRQRPQRRHEHERTASHPRAGRRGRPWAGQGRARGWGTHAA